MMSGEVADNEERLTSLAASRAEAIEVWVSLAVEQPDPIGWTNSLASAALEKLALVAESPAVKAEARLQIIEMRQAVLVGIANSAARKLKTSA